MSSIETFTGRKFYPLAPREDDIDIRDIAHALAHQCRFSGHCRRFYSVAEHSIRVAKLLDKRGRSSNEVLWGLMHDASEAYLVDLPTPLKREPDFSFYRAAEARLMGVIAKVFGLEGDMPECVIDADMTLLACEARELMPALDKNWGTFIEEHAVSWRWVEDLTEDAYRSPGEAEDAFIRKFNLIIDARRYGFQYIGV